MLNRNVNLFALVIAVSALTCPLLPVFATDFRIPGSQREAVEGTRNPSNNAGVYVPSPAEQARQQRIAESHTANERGVAFYNKRDWANAAACFQEAVNKDPDDPISRRNLANAQEALQADRAQQQRLTDAYNANERGNASLKKGDWAKAISSYQAALAKSPNDRIIRSNLARAQEALQTQRAEMEKERLAKQRDKAAAGKIQQIVQNFSESITPAQSSGGLDFDGRNSGSPPSGGGGLDFISAAPAPGAAKPAAALEFGDPMVVNARNVPSGLPKSVDDAIPHTLPGERVRKGFEAIQADDWKVALAWFQDALNKEPGDPSLKRLVDLAQFTLDYRTRTQTSAVENNSTPAQTTQLPNQNSVTKSTADAAADPSGDILAHSAASQMAARARADAAFEQYDKQYGDHADVIARSHAVSKAARGEGYSKEELKAQLQKALLDYHKKHGNGHDESVGGSPTADEIFIGGKG